MVYPKGRLVWQVIEECHNSKTIADLIKIIRCNVRDLIPHNMAAFGIGDPKTREIIFYCNIDYPADLLIQLFDNDRIMNSPLFFLWFRQQNPKYISFVKSQGVGIFRLPECRNWTNILLDFGVENAVAHGLSDLDGRMTSYFSFGQLKAPITRRDQFLLSVLIPHLHISLMTIYRHRRANCIISSLNGFCSSLDNNKLYDSDNTRLKNILTLREVEILKWAYLGKTNTEIGLILGVSEYTAKNHIHNILEKLAASNRAHAVAKAMNLGLLPEP